MFIPLSQKSFEQFSKSSTETDVLNANWPALVDVETFNRVQARLTKNRKRFKPDQWKRYPYPLTELLICGECGKQLGGKSSHGKIRQHAYYGHPRQINSDGVTHLKRCRLERVRAERIETTRQKTANRSIQT